jgi:hypothetical protein
MPIRHPTNPNLTLHYGDTWRGLPVLGKYSPFINEYLESIYETMMLAIKDYSRVFPLRFDLRLPVGWEDNNGAAISRFLASLKAKIEADLRRRAKERKDNRYIDCRLRFCWVKERSQSTNSHYHVFVFLNRDAYFTVGNFRKVKWLPGDDTPLPDERMNMATRIIGAWGSALGLPPEMAVGLVHFPENAAYSLDINKASYWQDFGDVFQRASYFTKMDTKHYGDHGRNFGCSRG